MNFEPALILDREYGISILNIYMRIKKLRPHGQHRVYLKIQNRWTTNLKGMLYGL